MPRVLPPRRPLPSGSHSVGGAISLVSALVNRGAASVDFVPMMQVSKSGWKSGAEENALLHRVTEWFDLGGTGRMFDEVMTLLTKTKVLVWLRQGL